MSQNFHFNNDSTSHISLSNSEENTLNFMNSDDDGELGNKKQGKPGLSKNSAKQRDQNGGAAGGAMCRNTATGKSS